MAPEFTTEAFAALGGPQLVYVRPVKAAEVMCQTPTLIAGDISVTSDQILYAVYRANGERLALLLDRDSAIAAALANHMAPVAVH